MKLHRLALAFALALAAPLLSSSGSGQGGASGWMNLARGIGAVIGLLVAAVLLAGCGAERPSGAAAHDLIAFTSNRDGNVDIYVMAPDGSGQRRLTTDPADDREPAWSPDRKRIAFTSDRVEGANRELFVMNADGSQQHQVTGGQPGGVRYPQWSPDGKRIAFVSNGEGGPGDSWLAHVMNADGSGERRLTTKAGASEPPAWSPDGKRIAFAIDYKGIFVSAPDGSGRRALTTNADASSPAWSPDGREIAFLVSRSCYVCAADIYVVTADGSQQRRLTTGQQNDAPVWSPDGKRIAFANYRGYIYYEIYVMNADGSRQRRLTRNRVDDVEPSWSPDGRRIAFARRGGCPDYWEDPEDCESEIYVMNANGSDRHLLTSNPKFDGAPVWSSGG